MMEVCDICGAFLIVGDAQSRIDDHLMGKQHMGYARLRKCLGGSAVSVLFIFVRCNFSSIKCVFFVYVYEM
jgi:hypothetical protein